MKVLLIGSGDFALPDDADKRMVIACDGGLEHCRRYNITPDKILGDFDSVTKDTLEFYNNMEKTVFPTKKDMTDMELGLRLALELGAEDITVTGALSGSRFDHSLCNICLLLLCLEKGVTARIINSTNTVMLADSSKPLKLKNEGRYISLLPLTPKVEGLTLKGFEYPLTKGDIEMGTSLCISNRLTEDIGEVSVVNGIIAVIAAID